MAARPITLADLVKVLLQERRALAPERALLVGLSGIDGAGKGWVAHQLARALEQRGSQIAVLNVDGWLNLPSLRFNAQDPARHFYAHAVRLEAFRDLLLRPLGATRSVDLVADFAEETATSFRPHRYQFCDVDIVLAEGIYLFKSGLRDSFDVTVWIDCPFEVALTRALARAQEGLPAQATREAYQTIYFPAQQHHFALDCPQEHATWVLANGAA